MVPACERRGAGFPRRRLTLNRPEQLNAMTSDLCEQPHAEKRPAEFAD